MPAWAAAILRLTPLWIWIAISLTILSFGAGGLVQRSLKGARLYETGVPVTATVSMEDIAGKAVPFGQRRTIPTTS